jgi:hypothetical protein
MWVLDSGFWSGQDRLIIVVCVSGYSLETIRYRHAWSSIARGVLVAGWATAIPKKNFRQKCELPRLGCYMGEFGDSYWAGFPMNKVTAPQSLMRADGLEAAARKWGCTDRTRLRVVCEDVTTGADIGCKEPFRAGSTAANAKSAAKFGEQVSDAIAVWVQKGFAAGPYEEEEVPHNAKINSILCREKPDGSVRIILNLSAPEGISVNDGIDSDDFPTIMSSTDKWLRALDETGRGCWIMKCDWSDAYKHIAVREEDQVLQWFCWGGKYFKELQLVFGGASSAGIYDRAAKVVLDIALNASKFRRQWVCQHLDDVCATAPSKAALVHFDDHYQAVAEAVGVKLAGRDDPNKSFAPCRQGVVLGVWYNTEDWTWGITQDKLIKFAAQARALLETQEAKLVDIQSVVGRIIHIRPLVPGGKYNIDHLVALTSAADKGDKLVEVNAAFKRQLQFWLTMVTTCSRGASIPKPEAPLPPWALNCFTDAAGGTLEAGGRGVGGFCPERNWWFYMPWSWAINSGKVAEDGKKWGRKLTALELMGPLVAMAAGWQEFRGVPVNFWVDNSGACNISKHGYSNSCRLSTSIVKATAEIAAAFGCRVEVKKITRCSVPAAEMADALSKADFYRFREAAALAGLEVLAAPARVPLTLLKWAVRPVVTDDLGTAILQELATVTSVLGFNC